MLKGGDHFSRVPLLFSAIFQFPLDLLFRPCYSGRFRPVTLEASHWIIHLPLASDWIAKWLLCSLWLYCSLVGIAIPAIGYRSVYFALIGLDRSIPTCYWLALHNIVIIELDDF